MKIVCKKKAFKTLEEAQIRLAEIKKTSIEVRKPKRAYKCIDCHLFHLTSFSKKAQKKVVKIRKANQSTDLYLGIIKKEKKRKKPIKVKKMKLYNNPDGTE